MLYKGVCVWYGDGGMPRYGSYEMLVMARFDPKSGIADVAF